MDGVELGIATMQRCKDAKVQGIAVTKHRTMLRHGVFLCISATLHLCVESGAEFSMLWVLLLFCILILRVVCLNEQVS